MTADREKLIDKIRKLRAKGENAAVTEEEANAFLSAAARLMAEHRLTDEEMRVYGIGVEPVEKVGVHTSIHKMHPACACLHAIGKLTGTHIGVVINAYIREAERRAYREIGSLAISGRPHDRQIAEYMFDQVRNLIDGAWAAERRRRLARLQAQAVNHGIPLAHLLRMRDIKDALRERGHGVGAKERRSFGFGMAHRMNDRIEAMAVRRADKEAALAVFRKKMEQVDKAAESDRKPAMDMRAYAQGDVAGRQAELGQGVATGQASVLAITTKEEKS